MKDINQIAAETAESILGNTADDTDKRITADIIKAAIEEATMDVPLDVQLALRVLLNHVEEPPSWHNCKATVTRWLDSLPSRALLSGVSPKKYQI